MCHIHIHDPRALLGDDISINVMMFIADFAIPTFFRRLCLALSQIALPFLAVLVWMTPVGFGQQSAHVVRRVD